VLPIGFLGRFSGQRPLPLISPFKFILEKPISASGVTNLLLLCYGLHVTKEPLQHNDEGAKLRDVPIKASSLNPSFTGWDS
jgi:hypothetical protein